jgi:3-oxoacyl-[acyl-carrier protein] reductase
MRTLAATRRAAAANAKEEPMTTNDGGDATAPPTAWPTYPDLAGKVAVVTGGSGGIGASACRALAANGVKVVVNGRDSAAIDGVVHAITAAGGNALSAPADCTDPSALAQLRELIEQRLGPVDVLLAFAGGGRQPSRHRDRRG